jgi:predicted RNA-binding protein YlxR (DUF448 family)
MTVSRRHVPFRTCIICGSKAPKRSLVRIVADAEGGIALDSTGRLPGRGTYVCADGSCVDRGLKRGRLEYALRTKLGNEDWTRILAAVEALSVGDGGATAALSNPSGRGSG